MEKDFRLSVFARPELMCLAPLLLSAKISVQVANGQWHWEFLKTWWMCLGKISRLNMWRWRFWALKFLFLSLFLNVDSVHYRNQHQSPTAILLIGHKSMQPESDLMSTLNWRNWVMSSRITPRIRLQMWLTHTLQSSMPGVPSTSVEARFVSVTGETICVSQVLQKCMAECTGIDDNQGWNLGWMVPFLKET